MSSDNNKSFWNKYKNDNKYKAKVQLSLYVVFIVLVIIYINVTNIGNNYNYDNSVNNIGNDLNDGDVDTNLFDNISNNYNYSVSVFFSEKNNDSILEKKYGYSGKRYKDNIIINKSIDNNTSTYYKIEDEYYANYNGEYKFIDNSVIYDLVNRKYIELDYVKKLIKKATLDHVTNKSNGNNNYKYSLLVRDIIQTYKGEDVINIDINIEEQVLKIDIDYSSLFKQMDENILICKISYEYTNIDKVEEFSIINDN